jgi:hypothetical protein
MKKIEAWNAYRIVGWALRAILAEGGGEAAVSGLSCGDSSI